MSLDEHLYSGDDNYVSNDQCISEEPSESDTYSTVSNLNTTDCDSNASSSDCDSTDSENLDYTDSFCDDTDSENSMQFTKSSDDTGLPEKQYEALSLLSCFLRNKFSASTSRDVINTFKSTFPHSKELSTLDYENIMSNVENSNIKEFHYCVICNEIFPSDEDVFHCRTPNCDGLRYKGELSNQQKKGRQPRQCFVFTDIKKQLVDLLKTPGIVF
jgi:hypothetical protein